MFVLDKNKGNMTTEQNPETASKNWWPRLTSGWLRPYGPWLVAIVLAGALVWQHRSAQRRQAAHVLSDSSPAANDTL